MGIGSDSIVLMDDYPLSFDDRNSSFDWTCRRGFVLTWWYRANIVFLATLVTFAVAVFVPFPEDQFLAVD